MIKPLLQTPLDISPTKPVYQVWTSFRNIADVLLVIFLLLAVYAQATGGGLIDAYTAKKIVPRVLAAAILINLSIYMVATLVDITNILGEGIVQLIYAPFKATGNFSIQPGAILSTAFAGGIAGIVAGLFSSAVTFGAVATLAIEALPFLLLFIVIPALLAFIGVLVTLVIRQGLLTFLIIIAPVACALYCLPNTEQFFKKWLDLLFKTLLVFPIVMIIFAMSNVMAVILGDVGGNKSLIAGIISLLLLVLPLFLVPFAFKFAGGVIGNLYSTLSGWGKQGHGFLKGNPNDPNSLGNSAKRRAANKVIDTRAGFQNAVNNSQGGRGRKIRYRVGTWVGGGSRVAQKAALNTAEAQDRLKAFGNGDDTYLRAATLPLSQLDAMRATGVASPTADDPGRIIGPRYEVVNGVEKFTTAEGTKVTEDQVRAGHNATRTQADRQFAYSYVLNKAEAGTVEEQNRVWDDYLAYANEEKLDAGTATGRWLGISIPYKGVRLDLRRKKIAEQQVTNPDGSTQTVLADGGMNHLGLLKEYSNMGSYDQIKETEESFNAVADSIIHARTSNDASQEERDAAELAFENLRKYASGELVTRPGEQPIPEGGEGEGEGRRGYAGSSGAAWKNSEAARRALERVAPPAPPAPPRTRPPDWREPGGYV